MYYVVLVICVCKTKSMTVKHRKKYVKKVRRRDRVKITNIRKITKLESIERKIKQLKGKRKRDRLVIRREDNLRNTAGPLCRRIEINKLKWKNVEEAFVNKQANIEVHLNNNFRLKLTN